MTAAKKAMALAFIYPVFTQRNIGAVAILPTWKDQVVGGRLSRRAP